jgi:uncharacterized membrane protein YtjA (UPF0391 family)
VNPYSGRLEDGIAAPVCGDGTVDARALDEVPMLITFYAVIAMIVAVVMMALGFSGVVRGAGGFSGTLLMFSILLFLASAGIGWRPRHRSHA